MVPSTKTTFVSMECFHMTSRPPYWCPKTMKRRPCWSPKPIFWELELFTGAPPFQGCPVINSVFGRLCKKTVPRGREDTRVWYRETMFPQMVSYDFPQLGHLHEYFLYLVSAPWKPRRRCEPEEGYLRCSKRFDHRSHPISFVIVRVYFSYEGLV